MAGYNPAINQGLDPASVYGLGDGAAVACNGSPQNYQVDMDQIAAMLARPDGAELLPRTFTVATYNQTNWNYWASTDAIYQSNVYYHTATVTTATETNSIITQQIFSYEGEMVTFEEFWMLTKLTADERQAWYEARRASWTKFFVDREEVNRRAWNTLIEFLTDEQLFSLQFCDYFEVETNGRLYRINRVGRAQRLDPVTRRSLSLYCIVPMHGSLPDYDVMLGKKLLLEADEKRFLATANEEKCAAWYPIEGNDEALRLAA